MEEKGDSLSDLIKGVCRTAADKPGLLNTNSRYSAQGKHCKSIIRDTILTYIDKYVHKYIP